MDWQAGKEAVQITATNIREIFQLSIIWTCIHKEYPGQIKCVGLFLDQFYLRFPTLLEVEAAVAVVML